MIRFNYYKWDKTTFVGWVDKALEISLSKYNIKNEFKITRIWLFNLRAMDNKTMPNEMYIFIFNMNILDEKNKNLDEESYNYQVWGEYGAIKKLIEISSVGEFVKLRYNATSVLSNYLRYYVDQLKSLIQFFLNIYILNE